MLQDIYSWFTSNLKGRAMDSHKSSSNSQDNSPEVVFSLYPGSHDPCDLVSICDNASFNSEWFKDSNKPVFRCNCQLQQTMHRGIHDEDLSQYLGVHPLHTPFHVSFLISRLVSSMSLIVRLNGLSQSWKIWLSSGITSRVSPLIMQNISPSSMQPSYAGFNRN